MHIIMLGKPGSGKGTVGKILSESMNLTHISSGDLFRNYIGNAGDIGEEIKSYIAEGKLVPDDLTIKLVGKRLSEPDCKDGVILDGFPRTIAQAEKLDEILKEQGNKINIALELDISDQGVIDRIVNRRVCSNADCGEIYNVKFKKPEQEDICDKCGSKLYQRDDDKLETIDKRLKTYYETSAKLAPYYKEQGILYYEKIDINSDRTSADIAREVKEYLEK